jgi:acetyltransferase
MVSKEVAVNALFRQCGLIRVDTLHELIGASLLMSSQPLPKGRRVAVLTPAGGAATISAHACENFRLDVPDFSEETRNKINGIVRRSLSIHNPLDLTGSALPDEYLKVGEVLAEDEDNDILLCIWGPVVIISGEDIQNILRKLSVICRKHNKPIVACFLVSDFYERDQVWKMSKVPVFQYPEGAISAIARACDYVDSIKRINQGVIPVFGDVQKGKAHQIIVKAKERSKNGPFWLRADEVGNLLECYGIHQAMSRIAYSAEEAAETASKIGFPVAVKLFSTTLVHKTEVGGVVLNLKTKEEVKKALRIYTAN